jgi:hypothetical protein
MELILLEVVVVEVVENQQHILQQMVVQES